MTTRPHAPALIVVVALALGACSTPQPKKLPPFAFTLGMLTTFIDTAEAYRALCAKHLSPDELNRSVGQWFERNQELIDKVLESGRTAQWSLTGPPSEEVWREMRRADAARFLKQVAQTIEPAPRALCADGVRPFRDGSSELEYFPFHLKALGIQVAREQ